MIDINKLKLVIWDLDDTFWTGTVDNINAHDKIKGYSVEMKKNKKNLRTRKYRRFFGFRGTAIRSDDRRRSRGCRRRNRLRDGDALRAAGLH